MESKVNKRLLNISTHTFITAAIMLVCLMVLAIILTYIIPRGEYATSIIDGKTVTDYENYHQLDIPGINIFKGIFAPFLILGTSDGLTVIMLSIFILIIAGAFQAMSDCNGIKVIVKAIVNRFKHKRFFLLCIIAFVFMLFGAMLGLFEEMLTLLPIIAIVAISVGYDSFTGFLVSIVACGFGFASAITNPFTVLFASEIIDVNPLINAWYRVIIFIVMYLLIVLGIYLYTRHITKDPTKSLTYDHDLDLKEDLEEDTEIPNQKKIFLTYIIFFSLVLVIIFIFSLISAIRDYTVVALSATFLIGGLIASYIASSSIKNTLKSFGKGSLSALPTIIFILLASSIKYILVEGKVIDTISNSINSLLTSSNPYSIAAILFVIVLVLEFFISSSTAKAIFVMSILSVLSLGLTKETLVLIYTFGDGYTNLLFPTSPVLLIGLSMIGVSYFKWLKKSALTFVITFVLVIGFLALAILIGY